MYKCRCKETIKREEACSFIIINFLTEIAEVKMGYKEGSITG